MSSSVEYIEDEKLKADLEKFLQSNSDFSDIQDKKQREDLENYFKSDAGLLIYRKFRSALRPTESATSKTDLVVFSDIKQQQMTRRVHEEEAISCTTMKEKEQNPLLRFIEKNAFTQHSNPINQMFLTKYIQSLEVEDKDEQEKNILDEISDWQDALAYVLMKVEQGINETGYVIAKIENAKDSKAQAEVCNFVATLYPMQNRLYGKGKPISYQGVVGILLWLVDPADDESFICEIGSLSTFFGSVPHGKSHNDRNLDKNSVEFCKLGFINAGITPERIERALEIESRRAMKPISG